MNNKGFAVTTIVYSVIILLSLIMLTCLGLLVGEYDNQKTFVNDINNELENCIELGTC